MTKGNTELRDRVLAILLAIIMVAATMPFSAITAYAAAPYHLTYDKNTTEDVTNMPAEDTTEYGEGEEATVSTTIPEREGYTFGGWYLEPECNTPSGATIIMTADTTLFAKWNSPHTHNFAFTADENKLVATCNATGTCDLPDHKVTLTLSAPEDLVYSGESKSAVLTGTEDWEAVGLEVPQITYNEEPKDVGSYTATITKDEASAVVNFEITKATPAYSAPTLSAEYGQTLGDVELPEGFTWQDDEDTSVGDIGEQSFKATFTPEDTDNYKVITDIDVTITVTKASRTINAPAFDPDFAATQTEIHLLPVTPSKGDGTVEYGISLIKDDSDSISWQAGTVFTGLEGSTTYYFFARVTGSDYYADAVSSGGASYSTANKKNATVTLNIEGWTYGDTANAPVYSVSEGDYAAPVVEYAEKDGSVWSTDVPDQAGTYTVRVTYYATSVYGEASNSANFTIAQKEVTLTWSNDTLTYNAKEQKPTVEITAGNIDGENLSVTVSGEKKDVGEYTATASLTGTAANNYKIKVAEQTKSFTIEAKEITITWSNTFLTHSQEKQKPTATINDGEIFDGDDVSVKVSGEKKRPGNYTATASLTGDQAANYAIKEDLRECGFVISNLETPANPFRIVRADSYKNDNTEIEANANDNHWYNYDVIILPADGYQIGVADEKESDFKEFIEITECEENYKVFLMKINPDSGVGEFTGEIPIGSAFNNENSNINIDKVAPRASATLSEETIWDTILETVTFGLYHNSERVVTIGGTDELSTVDKVYYYVLSKERLSNSDLFENNGTGEGKDIAAWTDWTEGTSVTVNIDNDYVVYGKVVDKAGNITYTSTRDFVYDATPSTIKVEFDGSASNGKYFKANRTAKITITEHNFDESKVKLEVTEGGIDTSSNYVLSWDPDGDEYEATVTFTNEADYTFAISCEDKAGNNNSPVEYIGVAPTEFTIDKSHPNATIVIGGMISGASDPWEASWQTTDDDELTDRVLQSIDYNGRWTNTNAIVSATSSDNLSGIDYIEFFKASELKSVGDIGSWNSTKGTTDVDKFSFEVAPNESFIVYAHIVDKAGNEIYLSSNGVIVDDKAPEGDNYSPDIDITLPKTNANGFYNGSVEVQFKVVEPKYIGAATEDQEKGVYSGLNKITYEIEAKDLNVKETNSFDLSNGSVTDENGLLSSWTGSISIDKEKFNSNNVVVTITAVDNAGNVRISATKVGDIKIDVTAPKIAISYNNDASDSNTYFKDDREATIVVTERNFNPEEVVIKVTKNGETIKPELTWTVKKAGTASLDDREWEAKILYSADGDYTFDISYTDLADNACPGADYGESVAPQAFTIDQTDPVIAVSYDNNDALNTNYYKADRTATIVITEHNFSTDRIVITLNATDDGAQAAAPTVTAWATNGDTHTATIHYATDALYTFDIAYTDLAGNEAADYAQDTFYVDKTAPTLDITGVADKSANNGTVAPVITYSDTNFDGDKVTITLTGINNGGVNYSRSTSDIHNGQTVTYADFEKVKDVDDLYTLTATLTDKAGNETTKTINFSANRFGSVYDLTAVNDILNKYLQSEEDIVFTETNVDTLDRGTIKIVLTKNGTPQDLVEGTDYSVAETGGDGQWSQYKYTIKKSLFTNDGRYSVSIYSVDAAGNVNENIDETKEAEISFGIDKTAPVIIPIDFESGVQYAVEVKTVSIEIKDNLVLESVKIYLNGKEVEYTVDGETYTFDIPEQNSTQDVKIVATDAAGNEYEVNVEKFLVSTNLFVRWYNNTPLFVGSLVGVGALGVGAAGLVVFRRKKKKIA